MSYAHVVLHGAFRFHLHHIEDILSYIFMHALLFLRSTKMKLERTLSSHES
jgi:hypothetical protein